MPVLAWADAHAGRTETSLMLHLAPDLVDMAVARRGNGAPIGELLPQLRDIGIRAVSPSGVLGDPTGATADEGVSLLDELVQHARAVTGL